jgi:tripartite-type tricarboxylate transporter receptor subunit TctC
MNFKKLLAAGVSCLVLMTGSASAETFPSRPIKLVVPFAPGGTLDGPARIIAEHMSRVLGQQVIVDNKPGAGGTIGAAAVAASPPDGYTLLLSSSSLLIANVLYKNPRFDTVKSYAHIAMLATLPSVVVVNAGSPWKDLKGLVAGMKAAPGKLTYGSPGGGTASHFAAEMLKQHLDVNVVHVPYKGAAPAVTDLLGGQIDMSVAGLSSVSQYIKTGRLRALAVTAKDRSALLSDVPTVSETYPGYEFDSWLGISAPAETPPSIVRQLHTAMAAAVNDPKTRARLSDGGVAPTLMNPEEFTRTVERELKQFGVVAKRANMKAD